MRTEAAMLRKQLQASTNIAIPMRQELPSLVLRCSSLTPGTLQPGWRRLTPKGPDNVRDGPKPEALRREHSPAEDGRERFGKQSSGSESGTRLAGSRERLKTARKGSACGLQCLACRIRMHCAVRGTGQTT